MLMKSMALLTALLLSFNMKALAVPMSPKCPPNQSLDVDPGSRVELMCGSPCNSETGFAQYEWTRRSFVLGVEEETKLESQDMRIVIESVGYQHHGIYQCHCIPDGQTCSQTLHVTPSLEFVASSKEVYSGEPVELTCTAKMAMADFPSIRALSGDRLPSHNLDEVVEDEFVYTTEMWIYNQEELKKDYECSVDYFRGKDQEAIRLKKNLTIYSYTPPEVLYTVEHTIQGKEDFGKTAKLGCTILSSPDTGSRVAWSFKGEQLSSKKEKYDFVEAVKNPEDGTVVEYILLVNNLQESDVGRYICHLHSDFEEEDEIEAWIRHDDARTGNGEGDSRQNSERSTYFYVFCFGGTMALILAVLRRGEKYISKGIPSTLPTYSTMGAYMGRSDRKDK